MKMIRIAPKESKGIDSGDYGQRQRKGPDHSGDTTSSLWSQRNQLRETRILWFVSIKLPILFPLSIYTSQILAI